MLPPSRPPNLAVELILERPGESGDGRMCRAVVREIRRRNPTSHLTFVTRYHELPSEHSLLDRVLSPEAAAAIPRRCRVALRYDVCVPPGRHLIDYLGACVGLRDVPRVIPLPDCGTSLGGLAEFTTGPRPVMAS